MRGGVVGGQEASTTQRGPSLGKARGKCGREGAGGSGQAGGSAWAGTCGYVSQARWRRGCGGVENGEAGFSASAVKPGGDGTGWCGFRGRFGRFRGGFGRFQGRFCGRFWVTVMAGGGGGGWRWVWGGDLPDDNAKRF
ncbi:hypothetical protein C8J57DRAFT_1227660 [Mycena rebaudengoi]|nr:hypothetical protein C8J57DRAFT_1227660 [Mycena rebaudengoi]